MSHKTHAKPAKMIAGIGRGVLGVVLFFVICSTIALADGNEQLETTLPVFKGKNDIGFVSLGSFGPMGEATTLMKIPMEADIVAAYVYMSAYSNIPPDQLGDIIVTVSNGENTIDVPAKCIGYSTEGANQAFTYRADATGIVTTGEKRYRVTGKQLPVQPTSGYLYGGGLVAIYSMPNLPETEIWIADGLDFFDANSGQPATKTVTFPFEGNRFERYGSVKIFSGFNNRTSGASAIWYKVGHGDLQTGDIIDTPGAVDYDNSSSDDPNVDTDPLTRRTGTQMNWSMVEFYVPVQSEWGWVTFQLESQVDKPEKQPYSGVWNMVAFKLPLEETGCGSIGDRVFHDRNSNGTKDFMEAGIPTVLVSLYSDNGDNLLDVQTDTLVDSVRTNRLGYYLFQNLKAGTYFVDIDHPYMSDPAVVVTTNNDPAGPIQVVDFSPVLDVDFGISYSGQLPSNPAQINSLNFQSNSDGIWINWSANAGTENFGFDVLRSISEMGEYEPINENVIPVSSSPGDVHDYSFLDEDVEPGETYYYQISDVGLSGQTTVYGPVSATAGMTDVNNYTMHQQTPGDYQLGDAYPNPFNGNTSIQFRIAKPGMVKVEIYNLMGQKIRTLLSERREAGDYTANWDGKNAFGKTVGSGIYLYKMSIDNFKAIKRIIYLK